MLFEVLALSLFSMAAFDAWLTTRRMNDFGKNIELNWSIRTLARVAGNEAGCVLGIMIPTLLWVLGAKLFNLTWVLALLCGLRLRFFWIQLESLKFEKAVKAYLISTGQYKSSKSVGADSQLRPPSPEQVVDTTTSSPAPTSSNEDKNVTGN